MKNSCPEISFPVFRNGGRRGCMWVCNSINRLDQKFHDTRIYEIRKFIQLQILFSFQLQTSKQHSTFVIRPLIYELSSRVPNKPERHWNESDISISSCISDLEDILYYVVRFLPSLPFRRRWWCNRSFVYHLNGVERTVCISRENISSGW